MRSTYATATSGPPPESPPESISLSPSSQPITANWQLRSWRVIWSSTSNDPAAKPRSRFRSPRKLRREPLRHLLAWAIDNPASDLTVAALARRMNLSERQFARVFKSGLGITPAAYIERMRLECACRLLETTTLSVDHVASASGFGTTETMHRAFRRTLNTTPGQHRHHFAP